MEERDPLDTVLGAKSHGMCPARLEPLRVTFDSMLACDDGGGAALSICVDGEVIVDLRGGEARPGVAWTEGTRAVVFSAGKAVAALGFLRLVDAGQVDLDRAIVSYWPEFGAAGKKHITVGDVLTHSAGLPYWRGMDQFVRFGEAGPWPDNRDAAERLAAAEPVIRPRQDLAYHALTFGWLLDEIVVRVTGRGLRELVADELAGPSALNFTFGAADGDVAAVIPRPLDGAARITVAEAYAPHAAAGKVLGVAGSDAVFGICGVVNGANFLASSQPAINGVSDARSLARRYSVLAGASDGSSVLSPRLMRDATAVQRASHDALSGDPYAFGWGLLHYRRSGFASLPESAVGHPGLGGALAFADPERRLSFAFVPSALDLRLGSEHERAQRLVTALYSLGPLAP